MAVPPATTLTGTPGDDNLIGTAGNDVIDGREGNDNIDGGAGSDWVTYQDAPGSVDVGLGATGFGFASGAFGDDNLTSIENVVGSNFDDSISASSSNPLATDNIFNGLGGNDVLLGGRGNDTLYGGDGQDSLYGQQGNDLLYGEAGNDFMRGGTGDDTLDGGSGFDRVSFFPTSSDTITGGVTVSLLLQGVAQDTGQGMDTLVGIEALSGTPFNDSLTGDANINWLVSADFDGAGGDDQLFGLGGNDLLEVAAGNHIVDGGADVDTLSFNALGFALPNGVTVSLALQGAAQVTGIGSMTISNVENLSGTSLDDTLIGDGNANALYGAGGNDNLSGGAGNDVLYGDALISAYNPVDGNPSGPALYTDVTLFEQVAGNDVLDGGAGDDILNGGAGVDTASFQSWTERVIVGLNNAGNGFATNEAGTENDSLISIENLTGSAFNDSLNGNNFANILVGGAGHDLLFGRGGDDVMIGGEGDDFLRGSDGADTLDGGNGWDRVSSFVVAPTAGITFNLNIQGVAQDTGQGMDILIGIEHASGTILSDTLIGNGGDNWLWDGGDGDASIAASGNDVINAGGGNDLVEVGNGDDVVSGGTGVDTLSFLGGQTEITAAGVTFNLALQGAAQATEQGSMTATGFENVSGSIHDDVLTGDSGNNILLGDWGADALNGGDGDDRLYGDGRLHVDTHLTGGSGAITLFGDAGATFPDGLGVDGNDTLNGGKGNDRLYGGRGDDVLTGGQGSDLFVIEALSGHDRITDFKHVDTITFDPLSGADEFSDLIFALVGKDTLISWGTGDTLLVEGSKPNQLSAADFSFTVPAAASAHAAIAEALGAGSSFHGGSELAAGHAAAEMASHALMLG
ncbi:MAG: calcium-binding protein [Sphingomicrobium sp.]